MSLYRLDASIRVEGSHSRAIADIVEQEWRNARPDEPVIRRHVGVDPIPATAWASAVFGGRTPRESRTGEQEAALALAATLTDELIEADALLFAVPLYNFGVSQHFKTWVDMVITDPRMAAGAAARAGRQACRPGDRARRQLPARNPPRGLGPRHRMDAPHPRPTSGTSTCSVVQTEFTLVGVNPALDQFEDLARQLRQEAEEQARHHGRELGAAAAKVPAA